VAVRLWFYQRIRLRAERRCGELLKEMKAKGNLKTRFSGVAGPGRGKKNGVKVGDSFLLKETLSDLGVTPTKNCGEAGGARCPKRK